VAVSPLMLIASTNMLCFVLFCSVLSLDVRVMVHMGENEKMSHC
jgi:hypothetical protein